MKKSAKQLMDALVDAVQDFDGDFARGAYYERDKRSAYMKARRELRDALLGRTKVRRLKGEKGGRPEAVVDGKGAGATESADAAS